MKTTIAGISCGEYPDYSTNTGKHIRFSAEFSDGLLLIYTYDLIEKAMDLFTVVSVGLSSQYISTGKLPTKLNMQKRKTAVEAWVSKNINRYKPLRAKA